MTRAASESDIRWLSPPPQRTAYFSRARRPAVVLRVSRTLALEPSSTSAQARVAVAMPERRQSRLSALRSRVSRSRVRVVTVGSFGRGDQGAGHAARRAPRCAVAARVGDAAAVVAALAGERDVAAVGGVEVGAGGDQPAYGVGALGDQGAHGLLVAEARARDEGVVEVLLGGVALAERRGDAALGPAGRTVVEPGLGDDDGVQAGGGAPQGGGEPGDAGADHHDVRVDGPAGGGGGQPYSGHVRAPKVRGMLSMRRVFPTRAATARIASPLSRSSGISVKSAGSTRAR
ncbi:hypothetical protein SBADM41S_03980 [Streptomyces badius]